MANLTYTDLETRIANQVRIPTSNTTEMTKIQAVINRAYRIVYSKSDWWWLAKRGVVVTANDLDVTIAATNGSTSFTFSANPSSGASLAGYVVLIPGETADFSVVTRIATHTADTTTGTWDAAFTGVTNATAVADAYRDTYTLPTDVGKLLAVKRFGYQWPLQLVGPQDIHDLKIFDTREGKPQVASIYDFATSGNPASARTLMVHPYPDDTYRLEIHYKQALNTELSGTTAPFMPDEFREILEYGALADAYPIFLNDTERGLYFQNKFNDLLNLQVAAQLERGTDHPRLQIVDEYRRFYSSKRRINPARANLGSLFDRWPADP